MLPAIARHAITAYSQPGELVVDPMCRIGTTLGRGDPAGPRHGRVELEPRWADLARANLAHAHAHAAGASGTGRVVTGDARGRGAAHQAFDLRIPRDGGIPDLLAEARRPGCRFDAVICESIDRIARRTYYGAKIEHELEQAGVALFAADEPILLSGKRATAILTRRVKQGVAEWYVLEMLEKSWDGACEHTRQGWNVGRPPYGYQAEPIPHPVPARRAEGRTKTRLRPDPVRAAVVRQIFAWRVTERLGYRAIAERLSQDPDRYPPPVSPDPARSRDCWGYSAVLEILRNPKYTGSMVWNRRASKKGGRHNPPEAWIWSPEPTHEPIVSRELFAAAQQVAPQRRGSRSGPGLNRHPQTRRSYPLRSLVTCELCGRRMRGKLRRKAQRDYVCEPPRSVGRQVAAHRQPEHPVSVLVRQDLLLRGVLEFFALRVFSPERRALLAQDLPNVARGEVAAWEARVQALQRTLADLQARQARLVRTLEERDDPDGTLFEQIARRLGELDREQQTKLAQLRAVVAERPQADAQSVDLLELLPLITSDRLAAAPEPLLRTLFERFQLQVRYHKPQNRATVRVALSDDSLDGLLTSVQDIEGGAPRQDPAVVTAEPRGGRRQLVIEASFEVTAAG
jgi:site-specific DNA recombinase